MPNEQPQFEVNPALVIEAYQRKLGAANQEIAMLEAVANQQQAEITEMRSIIQTMNDTAANQVKAVEASEMKSNGKHPSKTDA